MIIADDGSMDNSAEIIESYCKKDSRIKLYFHENRKNKGLKDTLLLALEKAEGEWIAFLESDDMFAPEYLEEKVKIINNEKDVKFIFNNFEVLGDKTFYETGWYKWFARNSVNWDGYKNYLELLFKINPVPTFSVVMLHKSLLKGINFNSPRKPCLDRYLWIQIANKVDFYYTKNILTFWRKHPDSYLMNSWKCPYIFFYLKVGFLVPKLFIDKIKKTFMIIFLRV